MLTKPHVVELILDLAGYVVERPLHQMRLLEPACGTGAFLLPAVRRLLESAKRSGIDPGSLGDAMAAFDIDPGHIEAARSALLDQMKSLGVVAKTARKLLDRWLRNADFLLAPLGAVDFVVGNPPYIRIEQLAPSLQAEYRRRFETLFDRADLYVAFIERALDLLNPGGVLAYVCADRWVMNRYGSALRRKIADEFAVRAYLDLHQASPFESEVIAYPSIFAIARAKQESVLFGRLKTGEAEETALIRSGLASRDPGAAGLDRRTAWFTGGEPWIVSSEAHLSLLRNLEARFGPLEGDGLAQVRIGVATGNDRVFIVPGGVDIEPDRLVPLVMRADIESGRIRNANRFVINAFDENGRTVDLNRYPRLKRYFESREADVRRRHVARKNPTAWFRTIDRVYPELVSRPKLLLPDIAGANEVVFDKGQFHPHHNLYFITSDTWDMEVLGALLSSRVALFFIWSYAVKMRGGYLRFQAQYLRRIRVPQPESIPKSLAAELRKAFRARRFKEIDELAAKAYGLKSPPVFDFVDTRS